MVRPKPSQSSECRQKTELKAVEEGTNLQIEICGAMESYVPRMTLNFAFGA